MALLTKILLLCSVLEIARNENAKKAIPDEIRQALKNVHTKEDFRATVHVNREPDFSAVILTSNDSESTERTPSRRINLQTSRRRNRIMPGASFRSSAARTASGDAISEPIIQKVSSGSLASKPVPTPYVDPSIEVITNPVQSSDKCNLHNVCVPVPIEREAHVYFFPQCIELPQCLGKCCDGQESCHAQNLQPVQVMVEKWEYEGLDAETGRPKFSEEEKKMVQMEKHTTCGCRVCNRVKRACTHKQEFKDCRCQCANQTSVSSGCTGNWKWDFNDCSCQCGVEFCPEGRILNRYLCKCVENPTSITPVPNGASSSLRLNDNVKLPNLSYTKQKHGNHVQPMVHGK